MQIETEDGVLLHAVHRPTTPGPGAMDVGLVVAHGFTNSLSTPHVRALADHLVGRVGVLSFDFRGHGRSGGHSTVGDKEALDVAAAVAAARRLGYRRVVALGFSMGGACVVRQAGLRLGGEAARPDAVVSVSAVAWWHYRGTKAMRRVHYAIERRTGRAFARWVMRTRIWHEPWDPVPADPTACAALVAPIPLLRVHGDDDHYFGLDHAYALHRAATHSELWVEHGMGHAETATTPELLDRVVDWVLAQVQVEA